MSKYFDSKNLTFMQPKVTENGHHMVMTNVHSTIKTKYINIDTRFQEEYSMQNYADMSLKLPQQISNVKSIKVTNVEIPASFYPFSLRRRNTYFLVEDDISGNRVIRIDDRAFESADELKDAINEQLAYNGLQNDIVVDLHTEDSNTNNQSGSTLKFEFYNISDNGGSNKPFKIHFNVDEDGNIDRNHLKSRLGWCLGFREPSYDLGQSVELVSESTIDINPFHYMYVCVDEFNANKENSFVAPSHQSLLNSNILARVSLDPNSYSFGSLIVVSESGGKLLSDTRMYEGKCDILRLHIQLLDEFGNIVDLNKRDFSFALEVTYT